MEIERTIYKFYCYKCNRLHDSDKPFDIKVAGQSIQRIFCPSCKTWIDVENTNLSPLRFKIIHPDYWTIVDEDSRNNDVIYISDCVELADTICTRLNNGEITPEDLKCNFPVSDTIYWYKTIRKWRRD